MRRTSLNPNHIRLVVIDIFSYRLTYSKNCVVWKFNSLKVGDYFGPLYAGTNWFWRDYLYGTYITHSCFAAADERFICREISVGFYQT